MTETTRCQLTEAGEPCKNEARGAMRTRRPQRDNVTTQVWWDDRSKAVPAAAEKMCAKHMRIALTELGNVLLNDDEEYADV
jgi:hypothetical protein